MYSDSEVAMAREMHTVTPHADTRHFAQRRNCVILQCERIDIFFFFEREITVTFQKIIALRDTCKSIDAIAREDPGFTLSR